MIDPLMPAGDAILAIPATYFYCPYWLLDLFLLLALAAGIGIGLLTAYGPAKLRYRLCSIWLKLTS